MPENITGEVRYWLSYGGGVNSTALAILLVDGKIPQYEPFGIIFADTMTERPETYAFIHDHFEPWLAARGKELITVRAAEGVLEQWERYSMTGSRQPRTCTRRAKIEPIEKYIAEHGGGEQLIGIDADESHRREDKIRPLVDLGINRDGCVEIIKASGLPIPGKSSCWCCPFLSVGEIIKLARAYPCNLDRIERLENAATAKHGPDKLGRPRMQFNDKPCAYWRTRASQGTMFIDDDDWNLPCGCYDG